jgi:hypothetical protein
LPNLHSSSAGELIPLHAADLPVMGAALAGGSAQACWAGAEHLARAARPAIERSSSMPGCGTSVAAPFPPLPALRR